MKKLVTVLTAAFLITSSAWAKVEMTASALLLKNSEQLASAVQKKLKRAQVLQKKNTRRDEEVLGIYPPAYEELKDAMRLVLSRPDQDGARANLYARVRRELSEYASGDKALAELTSEALSEIQADKESPAVIATYVVILHNLMSEIKPSAAQPGTARSLIEKIRDANLKVSQRVKDYQLLKNMEKIVSPSDTAASIVPKPAAKK